MDVEQEVSLDRVDLRVVLALLGERGRPERERETLGARLRLGKSVSRPELARSLRKLEKAGLVEVKAAAGAPIDWRDKDAARLTPAGIEYAGRDLTLHPSAKPSGKTLNLAVSWFRGELARLRDEGDRLRFETDRLRAENDRLRAAAAPPAAALRDRILSAFLERAPRAPAGYVPIFDVRRAVGGTDRDAFDRALHELERDDLVYLVKLNDAREIPEDQIRDGVVSALGNPLFWMRKGEKL